MIGLVRNEWKKVFLPVLLTTVLLAIAMSVLSCTIYQNYVLHYDLEAWEVGTELFSLLYPLFVVVPLCWNLYYERKNNFLLYVMPRVKIKKYLTAKWIAYALGTLCIIVIPYILSAVFAIYVKPPVVPFGNVKKCAVGKHPKSEKLGSTGQAACCARIHSRYFTGGSPSGLRV